MSITTSLLLYNIKDKLHEWVDDTEVIVKELHKLADNLDQHFNRISKAKVGGSAAAIVGGTLATIGFGLSFVTFGASLVLSVAGGIIGGAGGATVSGSVITDAVLSRKRRKAAEEILNKYKSRVDVLKTECIDIGNHLSQYGNIDEEFPSWVGFWAKLVLGTTTTGEIPAWDIVARTVLNSIRIVAYTDDVILAGARAGATAFKTIGSTAGRGLHIAGGVFGILLLPVDIYTLVDSSIDVHRSSPHKVSENIRGLAEQIKKECPSKKEIDYMIAKTICCFD